jgi:hypothetical protein
MTEANVKKLIAGVPASLDAKRHPRPREITISHKEER